MHPYTKKFEPEKISDVIGQDTAIKELKDSGLSKVIIPIESFCLKSIIV